MIDQLARKARGKLAALARVKHPLNSSNLRLLHSVFARSIMKCGSIAWTGAAEVHMAKLDRVERRAMRMCGFQVEALKARREASVLVCALRLLAGRARGVLKNHIPTLCEPVQLSKKRTRQVLEGKCIKSSVNSKSLNLYRRSFAGVLPDIWKQMPQDAIMRGCNRGWLKITKCCKKHILHKQGGGSESKKSKADH